MRRKKYVCTGKETPTYLCAALNVNDELWPVGGIASKLAKETRGGFEWRRNS